MSDDLASYRLLHLNLRYDNPEPGKVLSMVGQLKPDVISFAEVSREWQPRIELLRAAYPYGVVCEVNRRIGGVALLSRRPFAPGGEPQCILDGLMAKGTVLLGDRPVGVASLHLGWPWPMGHHWHIGKIAPDLAAMGDDALLVGDFNAVDWSDAVRRVADYSGMRVLGNIGPTWLTRSLPQWLRPYIGLPIDHAMVKGHIKVQSSRTGEDAGSDHLPIVVDFSLWPKEPPVMSASNAQAGAAPHLAAAILSP
jgi:endonuclease/exonuclease/phosphatase (EEP) superfamily protein YafD